MWFLIEYFLEARLAWVLEVRCTFGWLERTIVVERGFRTESFLKARSAWVLEARYSFGWLERTIVVECGFWIILLEGSVSSGLGSD